MDAKYERVEVPIPRGERIKSIVVAGVFLLLSIGLIVNGAVNGNDGAGAMIFYPALLLLFSLFFLWKSVRKKTRPQLTEAGAAAKQRDDELAREIRRKQDAQIQGILWFLAFSAAATWFAKPLADGWTDRTTIYVVKCSDVKPDGSCKKGGWTTAGVLEYTAHVGQQFVILNAPDFSIEPTRLKDCAVVDRSNWSCSTGEGIKVTLKDGAFVGFNGAIFGGKIVSRFEWWQTRIEQR